MSVLLDYLTARADAASIERVYPLGSVPKKPEYPYSVVSLGSPEDQGRTLDGGTWTDRRFVVQMFARTHAGLSDLAELWDDALKDRNLLDLDGEPFCWREIATPPYRDPDDSGVLSIVHTYRT